MKNPLNDISKELRVVFYWNNVRYAPFNNNIKKHNEDINLTNTIIQVQVNSTLYQGLYSIFQLMKRNSKDSPSTFHDFTKLKKKKKKRPSIYTMRSLLDSQ